MAFNRFTDFIKEKIEAKLQPITEEEGSFRLFSKQGNSSTSLSESHDYYDKLRQDYFKNGKMSKAKHSKQLTSVRQSLVRRCYEKVDPAYFDPGYKINEEFFARNKKELQERTVGMHEGLDDVEVCLFNQITSRFDEVLSVLRTIESLGCLVDENRRRVKQVREEHFKIVSKVSQRQVHITRLLKKRDRLTAAKQVADKCKIYLRFLNLDLTQAKINTEQSYQTINQLISHQSLYQQLHSAVNFPKYVANFESMLKRGYSDTINDALFLYISQEIAYSNDFWNKFENRGDVLEEQKVEGDTTVVLDESMFVDEEPKRMNGGVGTDGAQQDGIVSSLIRGWQEGEYTVGNLKAAIDRFLKEVSSKFMSECRNFCAMFCKRWGKKVDNPSLSVLLQLMSITFCSKSFQFYFEVFRVMMVRTVSLVWKCVNAVLLESLTAQTIEQKQKLTILVDGLISVATFTFNTIYEKALDFVEMKTIHEATDIGDLKIIMNVLDSQEEYVEKRISKFVDYSVPQGSFLKDKILLLKSRFRLAMITEVKNAKVANFMERTHKFVLETQLRESMQNQTWQPEDIPTSYYDSLHYLISGEYLNLKRNRTSSARAFSSNSCDTSVLMDRMQKETMDIQQSTVGGFRIIRNEIIVEGKTYKVTGTMLLLVEVIEDYMYIGQCYPSVKKEVGVKISELLRNYNASALQMIINGGAVALGKIKSKNILAKHLALSSLCLSFLLYIINCIASRVEIQQLLKIKKEIEDHDDTTIKKLNIILLQKVNQSLPQINTLTTPSKGTEAIVSTTKILHDILKDFYNKAVLSRIFTKESPQAYLGKLKTLQIQTKMSAQALRDDVEFYFTELTFLEPLIAEFKQYRLEAEAIIKAGFESL